MTLTAMELERARRIEENNQRMLQIGLKSAVDDLCASQAASQPAPKPRQKRAAPTYVEVSEADLRRSGRSKTEVNYNEHAFFKAAEDALQVERQRRIVKVKKGGGGGGRRVCCKTAGWSPVMGMAGHAAQDKCYEAAEAHMEGLPNPARCKIMTPSMVSGGFWCSAPTGLKGLVPATTKCPFTAFLPEGEAVPEHAQHSSKHGDWWDIVWLPHGKGGAYGFSGNWRGFAIDNRLFPGDVVVAEVLPADQRRGGSAGNAFAITFHLFRALDYESEREREVRLANMPAEVAAEEAEEEGASQAEAAGEDEEEEEEVEAQPAGAAAALEFSEQAGEGRQAGEEGVAADGEVAAGEGAACTAHKRQAQLAEPSTKRQKQAGGASGGGGASAAAARLAAKQGGAAHHNSPEQQQQQPEQRSVQQQPAGKKQQVKQIKAAGKKAAAKRPAKAAEKKKAVAAVQEEEEEEESFFVERIMGVKGSGANRLFLIKWEGYNEQTWEPLSMLDEPLHTYRRAPGVKL